MNVWAKVQDLYKLPYPNIQLNKLSYHKVLQSVKNCKNCV